MILEIACFSLLGAITAQTAGADRIEFCENPEEGGTTPSFGALKVLRDKISIPVFPIIRPRGGDFLYSPEEFEIMKQDILLCKELGFEGAVTGLLLADGSIDTYRTKILVDLSYPLEITFHRAFDRCKDPLTSLENVIDTGCQRILTSGQHTVAFDGAALINQLVTAANHRITIMPGSGVNSKNLNDLVSSTQATEFHASARTPINTAMNYEVPGMNEKLVYMGVNAAEVTLMKSVLQSINLNESS
ncbi:MAG: copper homeostasis protein CutC [Bacteroidota bacterium]